MLTCKRMFAVVMLACLLAACGTATTPIPSRPTTENVEIKFLDLATKKIVREFAEHTRAPYQIAFSPNGSLLASASDDGTLRLWDMQTGVNVETIRLKHEAGAVAFSPDGTLIAVSVWGEGGQVWAISPAAISTPTPLPPLSGSDTGLIAFTSDRDGNDEIYIMPAPGPQAQVNTDGSDQRNLINHPACDDDPHWSPDGSLIAFSSDRSGNYEIYVLSVAGETDSDDTNLQRLTHNPAADVQPTWSPDGRRIAFVSLRDGDAEIYVINADGSDLQRLTENRFGDHEPDW